MRTPIWIQKLLIYCGDCPAIVWERDPQFWMRMYKPAMRIIGVVSVGVLIGGLILAASR